MEIKISEIHESPYTIKFVDKSSLYYRRLKDSIRKIGLIDPITVRSVNTYYYEIVHGTFRFNACRDLNFETIEVNVVSLTDEQVLEAILASQYHRLEPNRKDIARQLRRIIAKDPERTVNYYAGSLKVQPELLKDQLGIHRIIAEGRTLIDRGDINIGNAYLLARIPRPFQEELLLPAQKLLYSEFNDLVVPRLKQYREAQI